MKAGRAVLYTDYFKYYGPTTVPARSLSPLMSTVAHGGFARVLTWHGWQPRHYSFDYASESSNSIDDFASKIQAMIKKAGLSAAAMASCQTSNHQGGELYQDDGKVCHPKGRGFSQLQPLWMSQRLKLEGINDLEAKVEDFVTNAVEDLGGSQDSKLRSMGLNQDPNDIGLLFV